MHWSESPWSFGALLALIAVISSASTLIFVGELLLARQLIMATAGLSLMVGPFVQHYRADRTDTGTTIPVRSAVQLAGQTAQVVAVEVGEIDTESESGSGSENESTDDSE